jgi:hypothetical protein
METSLQSFDVGPVRRLRRWRLSVRLPVQDGSNYCLLSVSEHREKTIPDLSELLAADKAWSYGALEL